VSATADDPGTGRTAGLRVGPGPGRGAWLCAEHAVACLDLAVRRRALDRALRVAVGSDDVERLRAKLDGSATSGQA
jgi:predicted RNA-binding protein YlxR (DUF448 family)